MFFRKNEPFEKVAATPLTPKTIPTKIHFIWLGGTIPRDYLATIYHIAALTQADKKKTWQLNLWVDNPNDYYRAVALHDMNFHHAKLNVNHDEQGMHIRNIETLLPNMQKDSYWTDEDSLSLSLAEINSNKIQQFKKCVWREMIGYKNYAAASDILRYEILRQDGGYYLDTDLEFEMDAENLPLKSDVAEFSFLHHLIGAKSLPEFKEMVNYGNNDAMASIDASPALMNMMNYILHYYAFHLDNTITALTPFLYWTLMDMKRQLPISVNLTPAGEYKFSYPKAKGQNLNTTATRVDLTTEATGPTAMERAILVPLYGKKIEEKLTFIKKGYAQLQQYRLLELMDLKKFGKVQEDYQAKFEALTQQIEEKKNSCRMEWLYFKKNQHTQTLIADKPLKISPSSFHWMKKTRSEKSFDDSEVHRVPKLGSR